MSKKFEKEKQRMIQNIDSLLVQYDEFVKTVSPKHWRTTGFHISHLREINDELEGVTEITKKELENDWVKESIK